MAPLAEALSQLETVSLDELNVDAALLTRTDRKYVLDGADLTAALARLDHCARVLDVDGRLCSSYESVYFDTDAFDCYRDAARRRPRRFKVRTRRYVEQDLCWIEVKQRTPRGQNDKARRSHDPTRADALTAESVEFVSGFDRVRPYIAALQPVVRTRYRRSTLRVGDQRVTIDADFVADDLLGSSVGIGDRFVVETKSAGRAGETDRVFWELGHRPARISKYAVAVASFHPELPRNRWHRTLERWVSPTGSPCASRHA